MGTRRSKIAATGLDGLVGSRIEELLSDHFTFLPIPQSEMDITDATQVSEAISKRDFDIFLHLAAYTNVDAAESQADIAHQINVVGTHNVFEEVQKKGARFVYVSTDFVFDGQEPPFDEQSTPHPLNVYGKTKYEGEKIVEDKGMIVRISYPYRTNYRVKQDFVRSIIGALRKGVTIKGIADHIITLTFIDDIAMGLSYLFKNFSNETYHLVGGDSLSAYDAIHTICDVFQLPKSQIVETTSEEFYRGKALRPKKGIITSKRNSFHPMKTFASGLEAMKQQGMV